MKKVIALVVILVAMATTVFAQSSAEFRRATRAKERAHKEAVKLLNADIITFQQMESMIKRADSIYLVALGLLERRDSVKSPTSTPRETISTRKEEASHVSYDEAGRATEVTQVSLETPIEQSNPVPAPSNRHMVGATIVHQGDQGSFSGNSLSVRKGSEAYSTVVTADANAYLVRQMANGANATVSAPNNQVGLEGLIINKYRFYELEVRIVGTNPGNVYDKTVLLGRDQSITDYLLPGTYQATIKAVGVSGSPVVSSFTVAPHQTHSVNGQNVFWGVWGGSSW